jgi:hypothetical protein
MLAIAERFTGAADHSRGSRENTRSREAPRARFDVAALPEWSLACPGAEPFTSGRRARLLFAAAPYPAQQAGVVQEQHAVLPFEDGAASVSAKCAHPEQ